MVDNPAMLRFLIFLLALALGLLPAGAHAWNAAGHRLVAHIAWLELSPATRIRIGAALAHHPDHARWRKHADGDPARTAFIEAATWPDDIRRDPRFYDEDRKTPTPALPGLSDTRRHLRWHYLDLPLAGGANTGQGGLDHQLARLLKVLSRPSSTAEVAYALPWVIHLLADIHQPLHVASNNDRGGNRYSIADPFNTRLPVSNLHRWWDDRPGPPWLRGRRLEQAAQKILREHQQAPPPGNLASWLEESRRIARDHAYPNTGENPPVITLAFKRQADKVTRERLATAGRRLGQQLEAVFTVPRETP